MKTLIKFKIRLSKVMWQILHGNLVMPRIKLMFRKGVEVLDKVGYNLVTAGGKEEFTKFASSRKPLSFKQLLGGGGGI